MLTNRGKDLEVWGPVWGCCPLLVLHFLRSGASQTMSTPRYLSLPVQVRALRKFESFKVMTVWI